MTITHLLEDFSPTYSADSPVHAMSEEALEDHRLTSFEHGYSAGWDDAIAAQAEDQTRIVGALGRNLEDISFSYHEAYVDLLASVEPVFRCLVEVVLPHVAASTIGPLIVEQLTNVTREQMSGPVTLIVPAGAGSALQPVLTREVSMPVVLKEDSSLDPGQAFLRVDTSEFEFNRKDLLGKISDIVDTFFFHSQEDAKHG